MKYARVFKYRKFNECSKSSIFLLQKELRAVRAAGQKRPGDFLSTFFIDKKKEVIDMVKYLQFVKAGSITDSTLVIIEWLAFLISFFIPHFVGTIVLQSVARVLP